MKILVLGMGNEIMGDDGVGLLAAEALRSLVKGDIDVILTEEAGLSVLDLVAGYDRVIVLDAMTTGRTPGEILEFDLKELSHVRASSRHQMSFTEVMAVGRRLELDMPETVRFLAMEIEDSHRISEGITANAAKSLPRMIDRALRVIEGWSELEDRKDFSTA